MQGVDRRERLVQKFGTERLDRVLSMLDAVGEEEGIHFRHGGKVCVSDGPNYVGGRLSLECQPLLSLHNLSPWFADRAHTARSSPDGVVVR